MRAWRGVREVIWRTGRKFHLTSNVEAQFYYKCNNASIKSDSLIDNCCYASIPVVVVYPELKRKQYLINNIIHIFHNSISCCNFIPWLTITIPISPLLHVPMISPASTSICANILPCFCFYLYPTSTCIHVLCTHVLSGSCFYMYPRRALFMHIHISPLCPVPTCTRTLPCSCFTCIHTLPYSCFYKYPHWSLFRLLHVPTPDPILASTSTHAVSCSGFYIHPRCALFLLLYIHSTCCALFLFLHVHKLCICFCSCIRCSSSCMFISCFIWDFICSIWLCISIFIRISFGDGPICRPIMPMGRLENREPLRIGKSSRVMRLSKSSRPPRM